jgi:cytochrome c2
MRNRAAAVRLVTGILTLLAAGGAWAADSAAGRQTFRDRCALCHSAEPGDNGGGEGPSLAIVYDHQAASNPAFSCTAALRSSGLSWDAATLNRFLADPIAVVPELPSGGGHWTRDVAFSADGKRMFVSVGSGSNVAEEMPKKPLAQAQAFDAEHGFGAAWDQETDRADVLVFDAAAPGAPDGTRVLWLALVLHGIARGPAVQG